MSGVEVQEQTSVLVTQMTTSCTHLQALAQKFSAHRDFFQMLDREFTQVAAKLQDLVNLLTQEQADVNLMSTLRCVKVVEKYSAQLVTAVDVCVQASRLRKRFIGELQILCSKFKTMIGVFEFAITLPQSDLFSLSKPHDRWEALNQCVSIHQFDHPERLQQHLRKLVVAITAGNAFVTKAFEKSGRTTRKLMMGLGAVYYNVAKKTAMRKARISFANPNIEIAKTIWNLMDSKLMASMLEKMAVNIQVNEVIFLPRVSLADVSAVLSSSDSIQSGPINASSERINSGFTRHRQGGEDQVPVRVLSPFPIPALQQQPTGCACFNPIPVFTQEPRSVIFHIHGGGFIAMSSRSHQNYTRRWANDARAVIFSVDYRLAPEHPYPAALDDVWSAYLWVVAYAKRYLGITPEKIVVTGDSAGGNLACGLINKTIESGIPGLIPRGALLTYPALFLSFARYSPSFEIALEDLIVHHTFLKLCIESYIQDQSLDATTNHHISPLMTPVDNLRQFPPIRIMVGSVDPLEDDCWRFTEMLKNEGVDVKMIIFEGLPHGFLGFDLKVNGVPETRVTVNQGTQFLRELLGTQSNT